MQFTYRPEGVDEPLVWDYDPDKIMNAEAEAIERRTGMEFAVWSEKLLSGSITATHGLLWVLLKRENPTLKYDQVVFATGEVSLSFTADERAKLRRELMDKRDREGLEPEEAELLADVEAEANQAGDPPLEPDDETGEEDAEAGDHDGDGVALTAPKDGTPPAE